MSDYPNVRPALLQCEVPSARLAFTVSVVDSPRDLADAVSVRSTAYLRHNAPAADRLAVAEEEDRLQDSIVLLARSRSDGNAIGSLRLNSNVSRPMCFERSASVPAAVAGRPSVELMRLAVSPGPSSRLVTNALAKAAYLICRAQAMEFAYVAARRPLVRVYSRFKFMDLLDGQQVQLAYAPGVPHSIMMLEVATASARWTLQSPDVFDFFVKTRHPDIELDMTEVAHRFRLGILKTARVAAFA